MDNDRDREPTENQIWAVDLIARYCECEKPNFTFKDYETFISEHYEEYKRAKIWNKYNIE